MYEFRKLCLFCDVTELQEQQNTSWSQYCNTIVTNYSNTNITIKCYEDYTNTSLEVNINNSQNDNTVDELYLDPVVNVCFFIGNHEIFNLVKDIQVKGPEMYHLFYFIMYKLYKY